MARPKGIPHTQETKDYLRKINLGKPSWAKGKKFSDSHRQKLSDSLKVNRPKEWNYKHWMTAFPKMLITAIKQELEGNNQPYNNHSWKKLRRKIYNRDDFVCQECKKKCDETIGIACHHIDYVRENNEVSNLITLCSSCHGKTTNKPDEWIQYYQDKMLIKQNIK